MQIQGVLKGYADTGCTISKMTMKWKQAGEESRYKDVSKGGVWERKEAE